MHINDTEQHIIWMERALVLAERSVAAGNHPFGALLVVDKRNILEAENTVHSARDLTSHAELNLVRSSCKELSAETRAQATLYSSAEPCAMCAGAIYWAGIAKVVYGCSSARLGEIAGASLACNCEDVYKGAVNPPDVYGPVLEEEAAKQHTSFWTTPWNQQ